MSGDLRPVPTHHSAHATAAQAAADRAHTVIPRATDATRVKDFYNTYVSMQQRRVIRHSFLSLQQNNIPTYMIMKIIWHFCEHMQDPDANIAALDQMRDVCASGIMQSMNRERALALFNAQYPGDDLDRIIAFQEDTGMLPLAAKMDRAVREDFVTSDFSMLAQHANERGSVCSLKPEFLFRLPRALENLEGDVNALHLDLNDLTHIPQWFHAILPRFASMTLEVGKAGIPDGFQHACNLQSLIVRGKISKLPEWVNNKTLPNLTKLQVNGTPLSPENASKITMTDQQMNRFWLVLLFIWRWMQS